MCWWMMYWLEWSLEQQEAFLREQLRFSEQIQQMWKQIRQRTRPTHSILAEAESIAAKAWREQGV